MENRALLLAGDIEPQIESPPAEDNKKSPSPSPVPNVSERTNTWPPETISEETWDWAIR